MRKTRPHPPTDRRTEDLKRLRREFRWAHRELDEAGAPRVNDGVELSIAGRIRLLTAGWRGHGEDDGLPPPPVPPIPADRRLDG